MPEDASNGDRIDSWKLIGAYLGCDARTAIRWEKERNLPIHRRPGGQRRSIFAYRHELDAWLLSRKQVSGVTKGANSSGRPGDSGATGEPAPEEPSEDSSESRIAPFRKLLFLYSVAGLGAILFLATATYHYADGLSFRAPQVLGQQQITWNDEDKQGLATDGDNLYFGEEQNGRMALAGESANGGPIRILWAPPANVLPVDLAPDGRQILALVYKGYEQERELWIVPLDGGAPRRLAGLAAHSAAWEPGGSRIAYAAGTKIGLVNADGTGARTLGSFSAIPDSLAWSPDGQRLRFLLVDAATEKQSCWELASWDGMITTELRSLPSPAEHYDHWTTATQMDGIFFTGPKDRLGNYAVWYLRHGRKWWEPRVQAAQLPVSLTEVQGMAYDRSGQRLFVLAGPPVRGMLVRFDPQSGGFREVLPDVSAMYLDYSRDGQWIAYVSDRETLWIGRADGSGAKQLTSPPERVQLPRWSPDGRQLAYMAAMQQAGPWRIYVRDIASGQVREASEGNDSQGAPTWSPDGRFLVYGNVKCQETKTCAIHRIDLATGKVRTLPGSEGLFTARWSPDGRYIAALQPERHQAMLFDVVAQRWRKLADAADGADLSWSANSKYVYTDIPGTDARILRIRAEDGRVETAADLRGQDIFALSSPDDLGFSIGPGDSIVLHRRTHSSEVYAYDLR